MPYFHIENAKGVRKKELKAKLNIKNETGLFIRRMLRECRYE
jgi:hypothetical protein